jgi:hypothetical protein
MNLTTFSSSLNTELPLHPSEVTDPELYRELTRIYNAIRVLQVGIDRAYCVLSTYTVTCSYGQLVTLGVSGASLASAATTGSIALGFCPNLAGAAANTLGDVQTSGFISNLTGLTAGATYYLSATTPGGITSAPPAALGNVVQPIGYAVSSTTLMFNPSLTPLTL